MGKAFLQFNLKTKIVKVSTNVDVFYLSFKEISSTVDKFKTAGFKVDYIFR